MLLEDRLKGYSPGQSASDENAVHLNQARIHCDRAKTAVEGNPPANEDGWAAFHAARREEFFLVSGDRLPILEVDLLAEAEKKLGSWRATAVAEYGSTQGISTPRRLAEVQRHLDETAENHARKRVLRQAQFTLYLVLLAVALLLILALEVLDRGLVTLAGGPAPDAWWAVNAVLYGTLGGAFSAAFHVASMSLDARYPEQRTERIANIFRAVAGGGAALVALGAIQAGLLGDQAVSGPRVAFFSFLAGFSERFIPGLAQGQGS